MASRVGAVVAMLVIGLHLGLSYAHNYRVGADDDRLWLYTTGAELGQPARSADLHERLYASLTRIGATDSQVFRFRLREGYRGNYIAAAGAYRAAATAVRRWLGPAWSADYPAYLGRAMYAGFVGMYTLTSVACLVVIAAASSSDRRWLLATTLAIAALALLETIFDFTGDAWAGLPTLLPDAGTPETYWASIWPNLPALFLNPHAQLSPFGDTPRNHFILLMLPLFLLRWRGRFTTSYLCLAALGFLHQSHTGLLLVCLVATDAVLRPALFKSRASVLLAAIFAVYLGRESLGQVAGLARPVVIAAMAAAAAVVGALVYLGLRNRMTSVGQRLAEGRQQLLVRGPAYADLAVIGVILAISFPVAAAINAVGNETQSVYFWTQVHGRAIGIFRPALALGLSWLVVTRLGARLGETRAAVIFVSCAAAALIPSAYEASLHQRHPVARIEGQARALDAEIGPVVDWTGIGSRTETSVYYATARTLDTGR